MKYNLSKIMKRAWEIKKEEDRKTKNMKWNHNDFSELQESEKSSFGICLEMAWEEVKKESNKITVANTTTAKVKDLFLVKKCGREVSNFGDTIEILKETEKAVYGNVYYMDGTPMAIWCPKSCLYV